MGANVSFREPIKTFELMSTPFYYVESANDKDIYSASNEGVRVTAYVDKSSFDEGVKYIEELLELVDFVFVEIYI